MMKGNKIQITYKHSKSLVYRRQAKLPEQKPPKSSFLAAIPLQLGQ